MDVFTTYDKFFMCVVVVHHEGPALVILNTHSDKRKSGEVYILSVMTLPHHDLKFSSYNTTKAVNTTPAAQ